MISVALCTYNGEEYIGQQLDSIFSQTMPVDEVVVCDDCSNDSTCTIVESYAAKFSQIRLIKNEGNIGFRKNFENALIETKGDYVFFSDQDDIWNKDKVKIAVSYLKETGMYGVYTDGLLIDQDGNSLNETLFSRLRLIQYIDNSILDDYEFEIACLNGNHVTGATLAITKTAKGLILPFKTSKHYLHDMWIALRLSSIHKLGRIDTPLISYRIHNNQECGLNPETIDDILINSFIGEGECEGLLIKRKRTISPIYVFNLDFAERLRIFKLYSFLYFKSLSGKSNVKDTCKFLLTELVVLVKSLTGIRVYL